MRTHAIRSISLLLTLVMLLCLLPTTALAAHDATGKPKDVSDQLYVAIYKGSGFPGEPAVYGMENYAFISSSFGTSSSIFTKNASTVLNKDILDNLVQGAGNSSEKVWGFYSANGTNSMILEESGLLKEANQQKIIQNVKKISASAAANYKIIWYVIKYQTGSRWHIDGVIVPKNTYAVNYYGNGNTTGDAPLGVSGLAEGSTYTILGNTGKLVRTVGGIQYEFIGWNTKADGSGVSYKNPDVVTMNEQNVPGWTLSLYAQWQAKNVGYTATVKTYLDGSLRDASVIHGNDSLTLYLSKDNGSTLIPLTHKGTGTYTATGVENGTYALYHKDSSTSSETHKVGSYTLSISNSAGSMDVEHYSVGYDLNGGTGSVPAETNYFEGTAVSVAAGTPTREGYYFLGWKDEDGAMYQPGADLTTGISKRHRLTAQWEKTVNVTINVVIDHDGGGAHNGDESKVNVTLDLLRIAAEGGAPLETGNRLVLTADGATDGNGNPKSYTITNTPANAALAAVTKTEFTANSATFTNVRSGYDFTVAVSKANYDMGTIIREQDKDGNWIITVPFKFDPNSTVLDIDVKMDSDIPKELYPDAVIGKILFWNEDTDEWEVILQHADSNGGVRMEIGDDGKGSGSYPVWNKDSDGKAYYYRMAISAFVFGDTIYPTKEYSNNQYGAVYTYNNYKATHTNDTTGGVLNGGYYGAWFNESGAQVGTVHADISLDMYNVTFKPNGGTFTADSSTADKTLTKQIAVPALGDYAVNRDGGYVFEGWYLDANQNGVLDTQETTVVNSGDRLTQNITLIAKWKEPLTIQGTITIEGSYLQDSAYVDIKDADRPKTVRVRLWKDGHAGAIDTWDGAFGNYSATNEIDTASVNYSFSGIPNDGTQYRIMVTITNYETTYDHERLDGTFGANEYTALNLNGDNKAEVNAHLTFAPASYEQKVEVDATAISEGFRPSSVLAEILYRNSDSSGAFARISQHEVAPNGIEIVLTNGKGDGKEDVWKTLYNAIPYEYAVNISKVSGITYSGSTAPYEVLYSDITVWDIISNELTGGVIDEHGVSTGILKATLVPKEYTVTFDIATTDPVGGMDAYLQPDGSFSTTHKWSFDTAISAAPTRSGYVFAGWTCAESDAYDGTKIIAATAQDITLTAQWKEDANGDGVPDENQTIVTFKVENGSWNDDSTADKKVWVTLTGGSGTLNSEDIPAVGSRPNTGYTTGSWDLDPAANTSITAAVTYTYTYALRDDLSYTVKHVVSGSGKVLAESTTTNQQYNASVTASAATFEGYTLVGESTQTVTLTQDSTVIVFYYNPNSNITVTFKHEDSNHNKLHDDTTLDNATMDSVLALADYKVNITGYDYAASNPLTYTVVAKDNVVTLVYALNAYEYTVEYYFDGNLDTSKTQNLSALYGTQITTSTYLLTAPGEYVLDTIVGAPLTIGADESQNVIRFYYAKDANSNSTPDKYEVTVTFKVVNGTWKDTHNTEPKKVDFVLATSSVTAEGITVWTPAPKTLGDTIPADPNPDTGYGEKPGSWDEPITANTPVTTDVTYNYRYHELNRHDLVIRTVNGTVAKVNNSDVNVTEYNVADVVHDDALQSTFEVAANNGYALESVVVDGNAVPLTTVDGKPAMPVTSVDRTTDHAIVVTYGKDSNNDGIADCFQKPVTFKVVNGAWNDKTTTDITNWIPLKTDGKWSVSGSGTLTIPEVGSEPIANYKAGDWNTTLPTKVTGTDAVTYIYTYVPEIKDVTVTFKVVNGTWDGSNSADKTVTVTLTAGKGTLADTQIPSSMPNAGYEAVGWDTMPVTATDGITGDVTYTYTYKAIISRAAVTFKVVNGTWDGSDSADKTVDVTLTAGQGTLNSDAVPNGMKANAGYRQSSGSWNTKPVISANGITGDVTYIFSFLPSVVEHKVVAFRVEHHLEDASGAYYLDNASVENKMLHYTVIDDVVDNTSYKVDDVSVTQLTASDKSFPHHTYDSSNTQNVTSLAITVNGGNLTLDNDTMKLFYNAKTYSVTYDCNGGSGAIGVNYGDQMHLRYGTQLYIKAAPLYSGYTFMGWALDLDEDGTLDDNEKDSSNLHSAGASRTLTGNRHLIAYWQPRTDLSYTVHYIEKGPNTQLADPVTVNSQTYGTTVQQADLGTLVKTFEHFTLDDVSSTAAVTIGMGDNIFNLYYTRNAYNYTVEYYYYDVDNSTYVKKDEATESGTAPYGSTVSSFTAKPIPNYELDRVEPITHISADETANVIKVYYKPINTATVTFKVVNGTWDDGTTDAKTVTLVLDNNTGAGTLNSSKVPTGMLANEGYQDGKWNPTPNVSTGGITRNVTYTYTYAPIISSATVTFKVVNGTWDGSDSADKTVTVTLTAGKGTLADTQIPSSMPNAGYEAVGWDTTPVTAADGITGDVTYTYTYEAIISSATVTFKVVNGTWDGSDSTDKTVTVTLTAGKGTLADTQIPSSVPNAGYKPGNWDSDPVTAVDGITGDVTYTYTFVRSTTPVNPGDTVNYIVEHYRADASGAYPAAPTESETLGGKIGDTVTAVAKVYSGFCVNLQAEGTLASGTLKAIAQETDIVVLKLYYDADVNGDEKPDKYQKKVTFKVVNGSWNDGSTVDKNVWVTLTDNSGTLNSTDIPGVGSNPDSGYKAGSWNTTLPTTVTGTDAVTFTYTYARKTGSVTLTKVDSVESNTTLANVVFELYRANGTLVGSYTTGADGTITVRSLPTGKYYWVEVRPAAGYTLDTTEHPFTVTSGKRTEISISNTRTAVPGVFGGDHYAYIVGFSDGYVRPEANITRAQVATIFFRLLDDETRAENMCKSNAYPDVSEDMWCNTAISTLSAMGILNGHSDGNFYPNASITRAQFAAIAARFEEAGNTTGANFSDIYEHWAQREINVAYNNGWILGYSDGTFRPDQNITRAEAITIINRVLQRVPESKDDLLADMVQWPDNMDTSKWYYLAIQEATNSHDYSRKENGYEYWTELEEVRDWDEFER